MTVLFSDKLRGLQFVSAYKQFGDAKKELKADLTGNMQKAMLAFWGL